MADRLGDKIGPRLAQLAGQYALAARRDHAPIEARIHQVAAQGIIDRAGREVGDHLAGIIGMSFDANPDMHPAIKGYLERTASGKHQWQAIVGALSVTGAGSALTSALSNELAPVTYGLVESNPHLIPDVGTLATLTAHGLISPAEGGTNAARLGYNATWFEALVQAALIVPDAATLFDAVNRGLLPESILDAALQRAGVPPTYAQAVRQLRRTVLSPADAALAVTRSIFTADEGAAVAALTGVDGKDFATLVANTGEPLGLEQLLEALRRSFIDRARFETGFRQARYRNEWAGTALQLAYAPMSTADAIEASIQGHLDKAVAQQRALENGLQAADFEPLYQTAGEPLSRTEMEQLFNRRLVTKAQVDQALLESRLKPKYTELAFDLHERLPEGRQVSAMISHGVITKAKGLDLLSQLGYSAEVAGFIVAEGTAVKVGAHKTLTIGEIHQLYEAGVFDRARAEQLLAGLGFDAADAAFLMSGWDLLAGAAVTRQAIGVVRSRYVARHFDETQAGMFLDSLGVAAAARDRYLMIWDIERSATVAVLTEAQIVAAVKKDLITATDGFDRLVARGYAPADADILLGLAPGEALPS